MSKIYQVHNQTLNNCGCWETDLIEDVTREEFDYAEISTNDVGGEPGQLFRLVLTDPDTHTVVAIREIESH